MPSTSLHTSLILLRANTSVWERPDRFARALGASLPYGTNLLAGVAASAARYPHATAVATADHRVTYRRLWRGSNALARGLRAAGVESGHRVGILCRNSPVFVYALLGAAKLGVDIVLLNTAMGRAQLAGVVADEDLAAVLHDDDYADVLTGTDGVRLINATAMRTIMDTESRSGLAPPRRQSRLIILTSGTTGRPKGAVRSASGSAVDGTAAMLDVIPFRLRDTTVIMAPFFHAWGLTNLLVGLGLSATVVTAPEFDAAQTLSLVSDNAARGLVVVPTMLQRICSLPPAQLARADTDGLRIIASSGSAVPGQLVTEVLDRFGPVLYNVYGSTEVALATIAAPADLRRYPTTAGRTAPGVRVEILGEDDAPVPTGDIGRIFVANTARFDGYTQGGGKHVVNGLMSTGDLGYFDRAGRLFVVGREDDMIVSGGENVYPSEIEELLNRDERIAEAAVIGVEDERFRHVLKAIVVVRPPHQVDEQELKDLIAGELAKFKVPKVFEFVDELPRNATGKVLRRQLT
ncbi:AMP-binding protein [Mycolicibacterium thermoresistibile]